MFLSIGVPQDVGVQQVIELGAYPLYEMTMDKLVLRCSTQDKRRMRASSHYRGILLRGAEADVRIQCATETSQYQQRDRSREHETANNRNWQWLDQLRASAECELRTQSSRQPMHSWSGGSIVSGASLANDRSWIASPAVFRPC